MEIIKAILLLGGLGFVFGTILAFASKKFAVEIDEKEEKILSILPGANCGGCGYPGCGGLATAICKGEADINACPVGGSEVSNQIGEIMGVTANASDKKVAIVKCTGDCNKAKDKYIHEGIKDCRAANILHGGPKACGRGCLGLGTCVNVCKFDAIKIVDKVAVIDEDNCVGCGKCMEVCPKQLIEQKPASKNVFIGCNSHEFGKAVKENCSIGCIGCGVCAKICTEAAITMDKKLPVIDYDKCSNCGVCAGKCPRKTIIVNQKKEKEDFEQEQKV